jgi:hypothetical protein
MPMSGFGVREPVGCGGHSHSMVAGGLLETS